MIVRESLTSRIELSYPPAKRVKYSEPNLKPNLSIVVGQGEEERTYRYHAKDLADRSNFIRSKLTSMLMRGQRNPLSLHLPDISPTDWQMMLKYSDPENRHPALPLEDALHLRELYESLGFGDAMKRCDEVISGAAAEHNEEDN